MTGHNGSAESGGGMRRDFTWLLVLLVISAVYVIAGTHRAILDDGDALYSTVARNMLVRGDLVVPYANGVRFLDKPPLMYWAMALSYAVFGVTEFAARFPSILAVIGCAWLLYSMARKDAGHTAGTTAAMAVSLCSGTFLFTRMVFPDMLFVFSLTLAMYGFLEWYGREGSAAWPALLFYGACGGAVLTKGLIGVVFPGAIAVAFLLAARDLKRLLYFYPVRGSAVFLAVSVPWHVLAARRTPGFLWYYFVNEHFLRFLGKREPHDYETIPLLVFWTLVLVWMFPWSAFLPGATRLIRGCAGRPPARPVLLLSFAWIAVIGVFFSVSSRIEHYSMPIFPPIALVVAIATCGREDDTGVDVVRSKWSARGFGALAALGAAVAIAAAVAAVVWYGQGSGGGGTSRTHAYDYYFAPVYDLPAEVRTRLWIPLLGVAAAMSLGLPGAWLFNRRRCVRAAVLTLGATSAAFCLFAYQAIGICEPVLSSKPFASTIQGAWHPGDRLIVAGDYETANSLNFYTDARLEVFEGTAAVLQWGARYPDAPKVILDREELEGAWDGPARVFLLAADDRVASLGLTNCYALMRSGGRTLLCNQMLEPASPAP
jgi:4-amino-4-deoxy-L-arabinose transferase-like glycosyltransferase